MLGCFRARAVPFNVNQHYRPRRSAACSTWSAPRPSSTTARSARSSARRRGSATLVLVDVDDGSGVAPLPGSTRFEDSRGKTAARRDCSRSRLPTISTSCAREARPAHRRACSGARPTSSSPAMGGSERELRESLAAKASAGGGTWFAAPPLMHAAAQWTAFAGIHAGATIVAPRRHRAVRRAHDSRDGRARARDVHVDRRRRLRAPPDRRAAPRRRYDLASLQTIATGGAFTSDVLQGGAARAAPDITIVDGYGASETGGMAFGATRRAAGRRAASRPRAGAAVLSADRSRFLAPGDDEIGWTARRGRVPLGYLGDREEDRGDVPDHRRPTGRRPRRSRAAHGGRHDRAARARLAGREQRRREDLRRGGRGRAAPAPRRRRCARRRATERRASARRSSGIVQLRPGATRSSPRELREFVARAIARFKAPRAIAFCEAIHRHASGKPDYQWARQAAEAATPVAGAE